MAPPADASLLLMVVQPRPIELRAVEVGPISFMDPHSRLITDWVRGAMHVGTRGECIEWWQRERDGEYIAGREHYEARSGDVIIEWPDGTFQVLRQREFEELCLRVGTEMWTRKEG